MLLKELIFKTKNNKNIIIFEENNEKIIKVNVKDINFTNWDKNRKPDNVRILQILEYYKTCNIKLVPGIIYCWKNNNNDKLIIYDGIHRLLASIQNENEMLCFLNIKTTENEKDIIDEFLNINKSISVPNIYLENDNLLKKNVINNIVNHICREYPNFQSPSKKCLKYNFNRDIFTDFLGDLEINYNILNIDKKIINYLEELNKEAKIYLKNNNIKVPNKCYFYDFFLFNLDMYYIKQFIEKQIKN